MTLKRLPYDHMAVTGCSRVKPHRLAERGW